MINNCSRSSCSPRGCWILTAARTFLCILHQVRKWQSLTKPGFRGHQSQQWMTKIPLDHNYQEIGFWGPESIEIFQLLCCLKCFQLNFDVWCQSIIDNMKNREDDSIRLNDACYCWQPANNYLFLMMTQTVWLVIAPRQHQHKVWFSSGLQHRGADISFPLSNKQGSTINY